MASAVQRLRAHSPVAAALACLSLCSGCLVDVRLGAGGAGALTLRYHLDDRTTLGAAAERLAAPSVVVRSARIDRQNYGTFKLTFSDVQALPTTTLFQNLSITRAPGTEPGTTTVIARYIQPKPVHLGPEQLRRFGSELKVVVATPGPVVATNGSGDDDGATWIVPLEALLGGSETVFSVTYREVAPSRPAGPA